MTRSPNPTENAFCTAFTMIISQHGPSHAPRRPSEGFRSVLLALLDAPNRGFYGMELVARTTVTQSNLVPLLRRMLRYGLITSVTEAEPMTQLKRRQRTYHRLTPAGRQLALLAQQAEQQMA